MKEEIKSTSEDILALYTAIGFVAIKWSFIEQALDTLIAIIFHTLEGKSIRSDLPRMLNEKIKYLRKALKTFPILSSFSADGLKILERISNEKDYRHDFMHSVLSNESAKDGKFYFTRIRTETEVHRLHPWVFDVRNYPEDAKRISVLTRDIQDYTLKFSEAFPVA